MTEAAKKNAKGALPLTVLYDGGCPLCRREVGVYRGLQPRQPDAPLCCADASDTRLPLPPGTTREQLLARFHVRGRARSPAQRRAGLLGVVGRPAWLALAGPGRSPAGCRLGAAWVMERGYRLFLRWRPMLQRWAFRLDRPGLERPNSCDAGS